MSDSRHGSILRRYALDAAATLAVQPTRRRSSEACHAAGVSFTIRLTRDS